MKIATVKKVGALLAALIFGVAAAHSEETFYDTEGWRVIGLSATEAYEKRCILRKINADGVWFLQFSDPKPHGTQKNASVPTIVTLRSKSFSTEIVANSTKERGVAQARLEITPFYNATHDVVWRKVGNDVIVYNIVVDKEYASILNDVARGFSLTIEPLSRQAPSVSFSLDGSFDAVNSLSNCL